MSAAPFAPALPRPSRMRARLLRSPWSPWAAFAAVLFGAPFVFHGDLAQTLLSQAGIAIIACVAYYLLLGEGGMLSFGHALYSGLGGFVAIHVLQAVDDGRLALPVSLVPLAGAAGGLVAAVVLGYATTARSGTPFAMITLGVGELVASMSLMLPEFFGGEGGVTADRTGGPATWGITFGPQRQVSLLVAAYCLGATALMFGFTRTPLGRLLNAVRDNPERVEFVGYSARHVRYLAFVVSGLFMGLAGGLSAIHFELVTSEVLGASRSGALLLFTFLGGTSSFLGPVLGALLMVFCTVVLSVLTKAWLLYLGLAFLAMVMVAPGGLAGGVAAVGRVVAAGRWRGLGGGAVALAGTAAVALAGAGAMVEMTYHLQLDVAMGPAMRFGPATLDASRVDPWVGAALALATGAGLFALSLREVRGRWSEAQAALAAAADGATATAEAEVAP